MTRPLPPVNRPDKWGIQVVTLASPLWVTPSGAVTLRTVLAARFDDEQSALEAARTVSALRPSWDLRLAKLHGRG